MLPPLAKHPMPLWLLLGYVVPLTAAGGAGQAARRAVDCGGRAETASLSFGEGVDLWQSENWRNATAARERSSSTIWWATHIDGVGFALCRDDGLAIWNTRSGTWTHVSLAPLSTPVGAIYHEGKIWVACFGSWPSPSGDSGVAVVSVGTGELLETHSFAEAGFGDASVSHVHNIYLLRWSGRAELFVAVLGNPWLSPPVPGEGLVRFNHSTGAFTRATAMRLNARSAVQHRSGEVSVLTQEPGGVRTKLAHLQRKGEMLDVVAVTSLPSHSSDGLDIGGGADVVLGRSLGSVWCTDRSSGTDSGKLYYLEYNASRDNASQFNLLATHDAGVNPRYMTILDANGSDGDVVVCNQDDAKLTVYPGLALSPTAKMSATTVPTVHTSTFFVQRKRAELCAGSDGADDAASLLWDASPPALRPQPAQRSWRPYHIDICILSAAAVATAALAALSVARRRQASSLLQGASALEGRAPDSE